MLHNYFVSPSLTVDMMDAGIGDRVKNSVLQLIPVI